MGAPSRRSTPLSRSRVQKGTRRDPGVSRALPARRETWRVPGGSPRNSHDSGEHNDSALEMYSRGRWGTWRGRALTGSGGKPATHRTGASVAAVLPEANRKSARAGRGTSRRACLAVLLGADAALSVRYALESVRVNHSERRPRLKPDRGAATNRASIYRWHRMGPLLQFLLPEEYRSIHRTAAGRRERHPDLA
jgi:hypothetical protein